VHPLLTGRPEWQVLEEQEQNIGKAEAAYRGDPELARDLERTGWWPERYLAALQGKTLEGGDRDLPAPVFELPPEPGKLRTRMSQMAEFANMRLRIIQDRAELPGKLAGELLPQARQREAEIRRQALEQTPLAGWPPLVQELAELLELVQVCSPPRVVLRETVDALDLAEAALGGWSLLEPVEVEPRVVTEFTPHADRIRRPPQGPPHQYGTRRGA
jgi:hypothetical protein